MRINLHVLSAAFGLIVLVLRFVDTVCAQTPLEKAPPLVLIGGVIDTNPGTALFEPDAGAADNDPGAEYALMAEAGMSFRDLLASLTTLPAERFGEAQRLGRIAPGFTADLVILDEDPSKNVRAFTAVRYTIRDGKLIYQASK